MAKRQYGCPEEATFLVPQGVREHFQAWIGRRGPLLLHDLHLMDKMAPCNRERIPARIVHAKGLGASGICTMTTLRCRGAPSGR